MKTPTMSKRTSTASKTYPETSERTTTISTTTQTQQRRATKTTPTTTSAATTATTTAAEAATRWIVQHLQKRDNYAYIKENTFQNHRGETY